MVLKYDGFVRLKAHGYQSTSKAQVYGENHLAENLAFGKLAAHSLC